MRTLGIVAICAYLAIVLGAGIAARRRLHSFEDFATGGGHIPTWMLMLSFMANFVSSNSFVGHAAQSYSTGLLWCVAAVIMVASCVVSWHFMAPRFAEFAQKHRVTTLPEFFEIRFGSRRLATVVNFIVVIGTFFYVLAILRGTALVTATSLQVSYPVALFVLYGVTVVYASAGGLWADVSTDVVQSFVLVAGAVALFIAVLTAEPAGPVVPPPLQATSLSLVVAVGLGGGLKMLADPKQVIVFLALRDRRSIARLRFVAPVLLLVVYGALFPVGYLARRIVAHTGDVEQLIPRLVFDEQILGSWFGALFFVALLSASMSSLDSALLIMASCVEKHVLAPLQKREPSRLGAQVVLVVCATVAVLASIQRVGGIISLATLAAAVVGATLFPSVLVALTRHDVPPRWIFFSIASGLVGVIIAKALPGLGFHSALVQDVFCGLSFAALPLVVRLATRRTARAQ